MPRAFPREFRDDVVAIARRREVSFEQIAKDFGISATTVQNCVSRAEVEGGVKPGVTSAEHAENRELKKRVRLLEQENEGDHPRSCGITPESVDSSSLGLGSLFGVPFLEL